jgi:methylmalonyl-CoA/ethylmalonyl-CoA epimerase
LIGRRHTEGVTEIFQVAQHADELDRAGDFYSRLLGAEPAGLFDPPGLLFFRTGSVRLLLEQNAPSALLYLKVDDLEATVESLRAEGVEIVSEPHLIFTHDDDRLGPAGTAEHMAFIRDSEGNTVGLLSHRATR